jgi:Fe-S cluster assembly protein SufD
VVKNPIHLLFIHTEQDAFMTHPRNVIIVGKNSQVTIVEEHVARNAKQYFTNVVTDIHAAANARVNYYKMQDNDFTATHIANIFIEQQKSSHVNTFSFSKGARLSREDLTVWQQEEASETYLHGLYMTTCDQQHMDHHLHVDHLAAFGKSSMLYKGVLDKKSQAVFNGKVHVHPATKQIHAHQENHNLLLSKEAEMNTKPELEIYAEDVKCTHGATVGQLDSEALFYLLSRGIGKNEAHAMLLRGFTEEIFGRIEDEPVRSYLQKRMNHHDE